MGFDDIAQRMRKDHNVDDPGTVSTFHLGLVTPCIHCGRKKARMVTAGAVEADMITGFVCEWSCTGCMRTFKSTNALFKGFWLLAGLVFLVAGVGLLAGWLRGESLLGILSLAGGAAAIAYAWRLRLHSNLQIEKVTDPGSD